MVVNVLLAAVVITITDTGRLVSYYGKRMHHPHCPPALSLSLCGSYNHNRTTAATTVITTGLREPFFFFNPDPDSISVHGNAPQSTLTGTSTVYTPAHASHSYTPQNEHAPKEEGRKKQKH
ncbi:hypothetical protein EDD37DRAFT_616445 [Exophiala viscosa]|uniref:uncharacterized protein n=1 Tax=Exophiala viscosa TaxID=2486360 RepID=UPI002190D304|nr:hypothetical protein EDD37DRAFT_616445 [Exophiala viscosa]